ncbi:hypothetical protein U1Q18_008439, partial [Sarracenia purpurea var. burkii]
SSEAEEAEPLNPANVDTAKIPAVVELPLTPLFTYTDSHSILSLPIVKPPIKGGNYYKQENPRYRR